MRRTIATSRVSVLAVGILVWLAIAAVIAAAPSLRTSDGRSPRPQEAAPRVAAPAPPADPVARLRPSLALQARVAAYAPGALRLRIGTIGTFRPTVETPARLRVVLTAAGASQDRVVRRVALTGDVLSAVFRHLQPGRWRWEVDATSAWTLARVHRVSGRVAVTAPPPPPMPAPANGGTVETRSPTPSPPVDQATTSAPTRAPAPQSPAPSPGDGGPSNQPAAPFGGGGAPTPEGPNAP